MTQTILIITSSVFLSTSILFLILFFNIKNKSKLKIKKLDDTVKSYSNTISVLNEKLNNIKNLSISGRNGFYSDTVNLLSPEDKKNGTSGETYYFTIYVKELERYTNGMSKIKLINIEVTGGFQIDQYSWIKESQEKRFSSLKKTSEIEWLEIEQDLKELRKEKLEKILNDDNK